VVFVETTLFTKLLGDYLTDDEYRQFQTHLIAHPDAGSVIRGSGGVRKVRWRSAGRGKSGGVRVIYYRAVSEDRIFLLTLYGKAEKDDLSAADLRRVVALLTELIDD
jgi:mRNA-degrading endonuclease RelE of RelBE toxin-antitoxin system